MTDVICDCCYVMRGWTRQCNCAGGPTRIHSDNVFGLAEPWMDRRMGRNEKCDDAAAQVPQQGEA